MVKRETEKVTNLPEYWRMIDDTIKLAADNKVNAKNAFDIDINCIDNLSQLIANRNNADNTWGRTGEALGAGAKIYGFRVDNVHQETYKILGGLHRHGLQGEFAVELIIGEDKQEGREGQREDDNNDDYDEEADHPGTDKKRKRKKLVFTDK